MKMRIVATLCMTVLIIVGCLQLEIPNERKDSGDFKVYSVTREVDGEQAEESRSLLFTGNDIKVFNWEEQKIIFTDEYFEKKGIKKKVDKNQYLEKGGSYILGTEYPEKFMIFLDDEFIYEGEFVPPIFISYYPQRAIIKDIHSGIKIDWSVSNEKDIRFDGRVYEYLKDKGLLM